MDYDKQRPFYNQIFCRAYPLNHNLIEGSSGFIMARRDE
jgi:hypothetical protein